MAMAINDYEDTDSGPREKGSRALAAAAAIYGLLALITGAIAVAGVFGLAGLAADPSAVEPARLLGMPWSLIMGSADSLDRVPVLLFTLAAMAVNFAILGVGAAVTRGKRKRG